MPKPLLSDAEAGVATFLAPMQESLDRFREASERTSKTYAEIAAEHASFLQHAMSDTMTELQQLQQTRMPAEFFQASMKFAWKQSERSLQALGELGTEICNLWFETLRAAPAVLGKTTKSRAVH